jgi:hypothetical protein
MVEILIHEPLQQHKLTLIEMYYLFLCGQGHDKDRPQEGQNIPNQ